MGIRNVFTRNADRVKDPHKASPEQHSRALRTALIAVLVLVGIGLTGWLITSLTRDDPNESTQPAPASTTAATDRPETTGAPAPSTCLENDPVDISTSAPETESWVIEGVTGVPNVSGAGPCEELETGLQVGFAHTMTGALVAMQWYSSTIFITAPDQDTTENIQAVMVDGPNRAGLVAKAEAVFDGELPRNDSSAGRTLEVVGYKILSYSSDSAELQIAYKSNIPEAAGTLAAGQATLRWLDGDWKIDPVSTDSWATASQISSLDGFIPWGPGEGSSND